MGRSQRRDRVDAVRLSTLTSRAIRKVHEIGKEVQ